MNKNYTFFLSLLLCAGSYSQCSYAQQKTADSLQLSRTIANLTSVYDKAMGEESRVYNGPAVLRYDFRTTTSPNFHDTTDFYRNGAVNYDGVIYKNVPLIYNLNRDEIESRLYNGISTYAFLSDRVAWFDLLGHHFIRLVPDGPNSKMDVGFYDELYKGKTQVLVRQTKDIEQLSVSSGTVGRMFVLHTDHYLKKGNKYFNVNSEGKLYDALTDKKKELKQYVKDNKLRFGDDPEHFMIALAAYYDHLTN